MKSSKVEEMVGLTINSIEGLEKGSEKIRFITKEGRIFSLQYYQDCCAFCDVEEIIGDVSDLLNSPITMAEEVSSDENPEGVKPEYQDHFTWTFYKFATVKGYVTIRWYGESNGYYSESATFEEVTP